MASRRSALDLLIDALALVAAVLLCALVVLILIDVAARYLRWFSLAWGLEASSRLSCQAKVADEDLVIEIPKYTINYEREGGGKK